LRRSSSTLSVNFFKQLFGRARPELIEQLTHAGSASFPSGHAANSAAIYLTMAILLTQSPADRTQRFYAVAAAVILAFTTGFSRIYLGVHWPSDVLAGWSFGVLWALAWLALGTWLHCRTAPPAFYPDSP